MRKSSPVEVAWEQALGCGVEPTGTEERLYVGSQPGAATIKGKNLSDKRGRFILSFSIHAVTGLTAQIRQDRAGACTVPPGWEA